MASVSSEAVAKWWPLFERNARRFDGLGGAEFDDLVQEQAEAAWLQMEEGFWPSNDLLERACLAWVRYISHRGLAHDSHPYVPWALHVTYLDDKTLAKLGYHVNDEVRLPRWQDARQEPADL